MNGRILYIFSTKALIYTVIMGMIGVFFYWIFKQIGMKTVGIVVILVFALIGFIVGTCKVPELGGIAFTKKVSGENIDDVIKKAIKFKMKKNRIYVYTKEEKEK